MIEISRDAQIVASALFGMGPISKVHFQRPHAIHPRAKAALTELVAAGLIENTPSEQCSRDGVGWRATSKIGSPLKDFKPPTEAESFPLTVRNSDD